MIMRYEDVVALEDFSLRSKISGNNTHQMMVERIIGARADHDKKKCLRCCINRGMGKNAFGAQELEE